MTNRCKRSPRPSGIEVLVGRVRDSPKQLMRKAPQAVLKTEMAETLGAAPNERRAHRRGCRVGYHSPALVGLVVRSIEMTCYWKGIINTT